MKNIKLVELLSEIKANLVAFVSIAMFVCLGIGLFLGIQWGGEAIARIAEKTFEEGRLHDVELAFPYGLTEDDIAALKGVEGVTDVEPGYTSYVSMLEGPASYVIKVQSLTSRIDVPKLVEGKLPTSANEIAMLSFWAEEHGYRVGDTVTFVSDSDDEDDADGMAQLNAGSFTITGLVEHTAYLSKVVGSQGSAAIGAGKVDCVVFAADAAFDPESYDNCYSNAYVRCDGLRRHMTFDDEYKTGLAAIIEDIDELGSVRGDARYNDVHDEASEKIADAEQEIADANAKLAEAEQDITDGEQALADGQQEIDDGKEQIADGEKELAEGREELEGNEAEYANAKTELDRKQAEAKCQLDASKAKLDSAQSEYNKNKQSYDETKAAYEKSSKAYRENKDDYDESLVEIADLRKELKELEEKKQAYDDALADYLNAKDDLEIAQSNVEYAASELAAAQEASAQADAELTAATAAVGEAQNAYDAAKASYEAISDEPDDAEAKAAAKEAMDAAEANLNTAKEKETAAQSNKEQAASELQAAQEFVESSDAELVAAQKAKDDAWAALEAAYNNLKPAYDSTQTTHNSLLKRLAKLSDAYDLDIKITKENMITNLHALTEETRGMVSYDADDATTKATLLLTAIDELTHKENGKTYTYEDLP